MNMKEARAALARELARSAAEGDGWAREADDGVNGASRALVAAVHAEHGAAWLGRINRSREERSPVVLTAWDGAPVCNFGADFVVPCDDEEVTRLVLAREAAPYTSVSDDVPRVTAIFDRVKAIGGSLLVWT